MDVIKETTKTGLKQLITNNYFSLSLFKDLLELNKIILDADKLLIFSINHCIHYNKMDPKYLEWLFEEISIIFNFPDLKSLTIETLDISDINKMEIKQFNVPSNNFNNVVQDKKPSILQKMLGRI